MITFMRAAPYQVIRGNDSLYESFDAMARGVFDPRLVVKTLSKPAVGYARVMASDTKRAQQTARLMRLSPAVTDQLREISFCMAELLTQEEFNSLNPATRVDYVRKLFFKKLVNDELSESFADVARRIQRVANVLLACLTGGQLVISHSFFMKVFEVAVQHPSVLDNPAKLLGYYDGSNRAYDYLHGFVVKQDDLRKIVS